MYSNVYLKNIKFEKKLNVKKMYAKKLRQENWKNGNKKMKSKI